MKLSHYINKKNLLLIILLSLLSWFIYDRYLATPQDFLIESESTREIIYDDKWREDTVIIVAHPPKTRETMILYMNQMIEKYLNKQIEKNKNNKNIVFRLAFFRETRLTPRDFDSSKNIPRECTDYIRQFNIGYGCLDSNAYIGSVRIQPANREWSYLFVDGTYQKRADGAICMSRTKYRDGKIEDSCDE